MKEPEVTLQVLGCGDAFASGGIPNTCFYVHSPTFKFLIDCGATSLLALKKNKVSTLEIDLIAISHFHGDHYGGLPFFLLDASKFGRTKPLTILSPPGCEEKLQKAIELYYPGSSDILKKFPIEFISYRSHKEIISGPVSMQAFPVVHTEQTLPHGLRIEFEGKIIAFSGDTSWTKELFKIAHEADLFICDCNFYALEGRGHLNYLTILSHKPNLTCKQLWLTHFGEEMLARVGDIALDYAWEGRTLVL